MKRVTNEWRVAVYWPGEGYGAASIHKTRASTKEAVQDLIRQGYGQDRRCPIHILHVVCDVEEVIKEAAKP